MSDNESPKSDRRSAFDTKKYKYFLPKEWVKKAKEEVGENPETVKSEIQKFRERVQGVKNLNSRLDDCFLLSFLRAKKFNQERAVKSVKRYYEFRKKLPEYFDAPLLPDDHPFLYRESEIFNVLEEKDTLGRTVGLLRLGKIDTDRITDQDMMRGLFTNLEILMMDQTLHVGGLVLVADFTGLGWAQLKVVTYKFIRTLCSIVTDTYPIRFMDLHGLNTPSYFGALYMLFKPFVSRKIQSRVHPHGPLMSNFDANIQPEILPECYGGTVPGFDNSRYIRHMEELSEALKEVSTYGYLSSK